MAVITPEYLLHRDFKGNGLSDFTITPMNPTEIVDYIHSEYTPFNRLAIDDAKKEMVILIQRYADWYAMQKGESIVLNEFQPE